MFSNLKNKSIAVKLPDKTSLLHGNITLKWNVKWSKCSRPFFILNLNITRERNPYAMNECLIYWICKSNWKFHAALLVYLYIPIISLPKECGKFPVIITIFYLPILKYTHVSMVLQCTNTIWNLILKLLSIKCSVTLRLLKKKFEHRI